MCYQVELCEYSRTGIVHTASPALAQFSHGRRPRPRGVREHARDLVQRRDEHRQPRGGNEGRLEYAAVPGLHRHDPRVDREAGGEGEEGADQGALLEPVDCFVLVRGHPHLHQQVHQVDEHPHEDPAAGALGHEEEQGRHQQLVHEVGEGEVPAPRLVVLEQEAHVGDGHLLTQLGHGRRHGAALHRPRHAVRRQHIGARRLRGGLQRAGGPQGAPRAVEAAQVCLEVRGKRAVLPLASGDFRKRGGANLLPEPRGGVAQARRPPVLARAVRRGVRAITTHARCGGVRGEHALEEGPPHRVLDLVIAHGAPPRNHRLRRRPTRRHRPRHERVHDPSGASLQGYFHLLLRSLVGRIRHPYLLRHCRNVAAL
mmetsp:Transcript_66553/g.210645  ORF Transcript_66553/g.210645 Transcript_66553/m.210645 type:complete len:370 (+) Transcript_66553:37-1146(+)